MDVVDGDARLHSVLVPAARYAVTAEAARGRGLRVRVAGVAEARVAVEILELEKTVGLLQGHQVSPRNVVRRVVLVDVVDQDPRAGEIGVEPHVLPVLDEKIFQAGRRTVRGEAVDRAALLDRIENRGVERGGDGNRRDETEPGLAPGIEMRGRLRLVQRPPAGHDRPRAEAERGSACG